MMKHTPERSVSKEIEVLLNKQIEKEFGSWAIYLAMASWADCKNFVGFPKFFYKAAQEEMAHGLKIFHYLNDQQGCAVMPALERPKAVYTSFEDLARAALDHEIMITNSLQEIYKAALVEGDFSTVELMQWFIVEQREEEDKTRRIVDMFDIINPPSETCLAMWEIDEEVGEMAE